MLSVIIGFITAISFGALGIEDYIEKDKFFPDFIALFSFLFLLLFAAFLYFYDIYYFTIESFADRFEIKRLFRRKKIYFYKDLIAKDYSWEKNIILAKERLCTFPILWIMGLMLYLLINFTLNQLIKKIIKTNVLCIYCRNVVNAFFYLLFFVK